MSERLQRGPTSHAQTRSVVAAYAGTTAGVAALMPAAGRLRNALHGSHLVLLWPSSLGAPREMAALFDCQVLYPTPPNAAALHAAIEALAAEDCESMIVFTQKDWSAHVPAYVGYLAGIERRAGIADEFGGGVLSDAVATPKSELAEDERYAFLLDAVGFVQETRFPEPAAGFSAATPSVAGGRL